MKTKVKILLLLATVLLTVSVASAFTTYVLAQQEQKYREHIYIDMETDTFNYWEEKMKLEVVSAFVRTSAVISAVTGAVGVCLATVGIKEKRKSW